MEKQPAENHHHYNNTTLLQKALYVAVGITTALAIRSCSPNTFDKMSHSYERVKEQTTTLADKIVGEN